MKKIVLILSFAAIVVVTFLRLKPNHGYIQPEPRKLNPLQWSAPPVMSINPQAQYWAVINTSKGMIRCKLFVDMVPLTVNNFVFLVQSGFYEGMRFYRVVPNFLIETGDPLETGRGGPGYKFPDENITGNYHRGTLVMGNIGSNTNGSKIFIPTADIDWPAQYVTFGRIEPEDEQSFKTLDAINNTSVTYNLDHELSWPQENILISSIKIESLP